MANSKYEYVKSFEIQDEVMFPNIIVIWIGGCNFQRFSEVHDFEKPTDKEALDLMNACALDMLEEYPDIVFSYGFSDEYSFVFKKTSKLYQRRSSKLLSIVVSLFTSLYVMKWNKFFPQKELKYSPSFHARVICCASVEVLQAYLAWRQVDCHISNQYNECFWNLVRIGKSKKEAQVLLKGTRKQEQHDLLFGMSKIIYKKLPEISRQGSSVIWMKGEDIVKFRGTGTPVKRLRKKAAVVHSKKVYDKTFWNVHPILLNELGCFTEDIDKIKPEFINSFHFENKLMPSTWIVVRIDGCHFHRFAEVHNFVKPNDEQALKLMNSCAVAVLEEFQDIVFAYGVSDEYSFVIHRNSQFYQRRASKIISVIVTFFTSVYVMKWMDFFPQQELKCPPSFDGRSVCYPSAAILRDYLSWRQVDCHVNNQYNTCFWALVSSGKGKNEARENLKVPLNRILSKRVPFLFTMAYSLCVVRMGILFLHLSWTFFCL